MTNHARAHDWLTLFRVSNLPTVWTNVMAALLLAGARPSPAWALLLVSLSLFYVGGTCLNDFVDREVDRRWKPDRPIPSGRIPAGLALAAAVALLVGGVFLLRWAPDPRALIPGTLLAGTIVAYDLLHARFDWSVYLMAACRFLVFPTVAVGATGTAPALVLFGGAAQFLWILFVSRTARAEKVRGVEYALPVIPLMLAAISLVDGAFMAAAAGAAWLAAGAAGTALTLVGQRWVRGD